MKIEVFDPAMCCSTGICGSDVDPALVRYAADLEWLKRQGVEVSRYNLAQNPAEFANSVIVKDALTKDGTKCLPLIIANEKIVSSGQYPTREVLAKFAEIASQPSAVNTAPSPLSICGGQKTNKGGKCCG